MPVQPRSFLHPWVQRTAIAALLGIASCGFAQAQLAQIVGGARTIDGDTVVIGPVHVRLRGLDAPELHHPGGDEAREAMRAIVGDHNLTCRPDGTKTHKRIVATCTINVDGVEQDIARELVRKGFALDCAHFSHGAYAADETAQAQATLSRASYCQTRRAQR